MENIAIREAARTAHVYLWEIAKEIGVSEATITRWMRCQLTAEQNSRVMDAIAKLSREGGDVNA